MAANLRRVATVVTLSALLVACGEGSRSGSPETGPTLSSESGAQAPTTFFVAPSGSDSNPGTQRRPWRTIQRAFDALRPGQTALVRTGTYGNARCGRGKGGSAAGGYATLKAFPGERPVIAAAADGVVKVDCSYLRIEGFVIEGPGVVGGTIVYGLQDSDHVVLAGNEIRGSICQGVFTEEETDEWTIVRNWVHDNGRGCDQQAHGIYLQGDGHLVANNLIDRHPEGYGIQAYDYSRSVRIVNNTIAHSGKGGIVIGGSGCRSGGGCGVAGIVVVNNILAYNASSGMVKNAAGPASCDIHSNLAFANGGGSYASGWPAACLGNNATADPLFAAPERGDYRLRAGSPAIDAGDPSVAASPDLDGVVRLPGVRPDIGAYERFALPASLPASSGQTFFVSRAGSDSNPGTSGRPWRTIQKALDRLQPGQTALVRAGTFTQSLVLRRAGAPGAPITVRGSPGATPVIRPDGAGRRDYPVLITAGAAHFRLSGFRIEDAARGDVANVSISGGRKGRPSAPHDIELSGNEVRNGAGTGILVAATGSNVRVLGNLIHGNGPRSSHRGLDFHGQNGLIANNVVYGQRRGDGIRVRGDRAGSADGVIVTNNTVVGNGGAGISVENTAWNVSVVNNVVAFNRTYGIRGTHCCGRDVLGSVAFNNVLHGNRRGAAATSSVAVLDFSRGNILGDPRFVDRARFNLRLRATSAALDRALFAYSPTEDRDGVKRPQGAAADVGAYERRRAAA